MTFQESKSHTTYRPYNAPIRLEEPADPPFNSPPVTVRQSDTLGSAPALVHLLLPSKGRFFDTGFAGSEVMDFCKNIMKDFEAKARERKNDCS